MTPISVPSTNELLPIFKDNITFVRQKPLFSLPYPILGKISGCSLWSRSVMLDPESAES